VLNFENDREAKTIWKRVRLRPNIVIINHMLPALAGTLLLVRVLSSAVRDAEPCISVNETMFAHERLLIAASVDDIMLYRMKSDSIIWLGMYFPYIQYCTHITGYLPTYR